MVGMLNPTPSAILSNLDSPLPAFDAPFTLPRLLGWIVVVVVKSTVTGFTGFVGASNVNPMR